MCALLVLKARLEDELSELSSIFYVYFCCSFPSLLSRPRQLWLRLFAQFHSQ